MREIHIRPVRPTYLLFSSSILLKDPGDFAEWFGQVMEINHGAKIHTSCPMLEGGGAIFFYYLDLKFLKFPPLNLSDWPLYWGAQQSSADDDLDEEHNKDGTYHCIFPSVGVEGAAGVSSSRSVAVMGFGNSTKEWVHKLWEPAPWNGIPTGQLSQTYPSPWHNS